MTGTTGKMITRSGTQHAQDAAYSARVQWTPTEIRTRRHLKGWGQRELATALGVHPRSVTAWETGAARPQGGNLDALEQVLGDAPVPEPTLRGATNAQFVAELTRRLETVGLGTAVEAGDKLPGTDLAWPQRGTTRRSSKG